MDDSTEITHNAMNNCMFTKEDDFAWSADKPFAVVQGTSSTCLPKRKLLDGPADGVRNADIVVGGEGDRSGFNESMAKIVQEIRRILDADTQTDQVLRKASGCANGRIDRSVPSKKRQ